MPTRRMLLPLLALFAAACDQGSSNPVFQIEILDAEGKFPVQRGELTVRVMQEGEPLDCNGEPCRADIVDGQFSLDMLPESIVDMTEIQVELVDDEGDRWIGATPAFRPFGEKLDLVGSVTAVVGPPSTCSVLSFDGYTSGDPPELDPTRAHAAAVVRRNLVLLVGGERAEGRDDDRVTNFDQLLFDTYPLPALETAIGAARGLSLSEDVSLVVGQDAYLFELTVSGPPGPRAIALHGGAGFASALVSLGDERGVVIGGNGTRGVTDIGARGVIGMGRQLAVARTFPAAAAMAEGVLVVGGHADGAASAEWLADDADGEPLALALPSASGGVLFPSPSGAAALWIGYEEAGVISPQTRIVRGCPGDCRVEDGPAWERARAGFAAVTTATGTLWLVGGESGANIDLVRWEGGTPRIEEGPELSAPRTDAAIFEHASGVVTIAGGRERGDVVMCFPAELDSL